MAKNICAVRHLGAANPGRGKSRKRQPNEVSNAAHKKLRLRHCCVQSVVMLSSLAFVGSKYI